MRPVRWPALPTFPLFSKELIEQSNRRRTFVIRTLYALLMYGFITFYLWERLGGWNESSLALLGRGEELFQTLVGLQFFAIYAFLPGLTCGAVTSEKERDTLSMLLLTKLGPWTILIEKLLSRLMPMGLLLLLSLPMMAVAYSLGGVEARMIVSAVWVLAVTALQIGALALFCSVWFRTTAGAFVGTYVIGFCLFFLPAMLAMRDELLVAFGPYVLFAPQMRNPSGGSVPLTGWPSFVGLLFELTARSTAIWLSAVAFLVAARFALWPRAFIQPKQRVLQFFRWLDRQFHELNQNSFTKGIVLINESVSLPLFQPISWRETKKKTLGTTRYLIRFLMVIEPPLLFFLLLADTSPHYGYDSGRTPGAVPNALLWVILTLAVTVLSTGLIATEKTKQTLDVLLATPLTTREIIGQKLAGVRKFIFVMWIPLLTVIAFDAWWRYHVLYNAPSTGMAFLIYHLLPMIVYPALLTWIGFHFGLWMRTQGQALLATIGLVTAWCIVPIVLHEALNSVRTLGQELFGTAGWMVFSPLLYLSEVVWQESWRSWNRGQGNYVSNSQETQAAAFLLHFALCGAAWFLLRWWGYTRFARVVNRNEGGQDDPPPQ